MMRFLIGKIEWEDDVTFRFRGIVKRALLRCILFRCFGKYCSDIINIVPLKWYTIP